MTIYGPIFGEKNLIEDVDHLSDSAGTNDNVRRKIYDRNNEIKYQTVGETAGTSTITWTPGSSKTVDMIAVIGHNWDTYTIKYNTSSDFTSAISESSYTFENSLYLVNSQAVNNIVISITATQTAGETRKAGQIYFGERLYTIPDDMAGNSNLPAPIQKNSLIPLADGTWNNVYVRTIINWNLVLNLVTTAERDNFIDIFNYHRRNPFFFMPRPADDSDEWDGIGNHYLWSNAPDYYRYSEDHGVSGYDVRMNLLQAGGI